MAKMEVVILVGLAFIHTVLCADPKVYLRQTYPKTQIVDNYKSIIVEKDGDSFLACVVDNMPADKKVQWLVQHYDTEMAIAISTDTDTMNAFKYQIDKPAANNWRLKIQNAQQSDEALYICRVQLGGQQNANDSRILIVQQKPQIIDIHTSSDMSKDAGQSIDLKCKASGIPTPVVTWRRAGGGVLPTGGRELTAPGISVERIEKEHRGYYKCIARNIAGEDVRRIYVNVNFGAVVVAAERQVFQATGYSRELTCAASGNPVPTEEQVYWSRDGVPLDNPQKYETRNFFGSYYVLMKLTINDINDNDFAEYRCYAENLKGFDDAFVRLSRSDHFVDAKPRAYGSHAPSIFAVSLTTLAMLIATVLLHAC